MLHERGSRPRVARVRLVGCTHDTHTHARPRQSTIRREPHTRARGAMNKQASRRASLSQTQHPNQVGPALSPRPSRLCWKRINRRTHTLERSTHWEAAHRGHTHRTSRVHIARGREARVGAHIGASSAATRETRTVPSPEMLHTISAAYDTNGSVRAKGWSCEMKSEVAGLAGAGGGAV